MSFFTFREYNFRVIRMINKGAFFTERPDVTRTLFISNYVRCDRLFILYIAITNHQKTKTTQCKLALMTLKPTLMRLLIHNSVWIAKKPTSLPLPNSCHLKLEKLSSKKQCYVIDTTSTTKTIRNIFWYMWHLNFYG